MQDKLTIPEYAVETDTAYFWLQDNIVHVYNKSVNRHTIKQALVNIKDSRSAAGGVILPILINMTEIKSMELAAREAYAAAGAPEYVTAVALITRNEISRVLGNFFIGFNRPKVPTRLFNNYPSALAWIQRSHTWQ